MLSFVSLFVVSFPTEKLISRIRCEWTLDDLQGLLNVQIFVDTHLCLFLNDCFCNACHFRPNSKSPMVTKKIKLVSRYFRAQSNKSSSTMKNSQKAKWRFQWDWISLLIADQMNPDSVVFCQRNKTKANIDNISNVNTESQIYS